MALVPLPARVTTLWFPELELLVKVNEPEAAPAVVGSNCTWIVMATFGFKVTGKLAPENVNPAPETVAPFTVTGEVPVEVSVTARLTGVLTGSSPKFRVVVLRVRIGFATPVPVRATFVGLPLDELLVMLIVPVADPVAVGLKATCRVTAWPGFKVVGKVAPDMAKAPPETLTELMVSAAVPDEVTVSVLLDVVFTVTLPKLMELALRVRFGVAAAMPVPLRATVAVPPEEASLEMVIAPTADPVTAGSKVACRVTD